MVTDTKRVLHREDDELSGLDGDDISVCDDDDFVSDWVCQDGHDDPPDGKWTFHAQSSRGAKLFEGLSKRVVTTEFKLLYNHVDNYLLDQVNQEVKHLLKRGRIKLHGCDDGQKVTALDAFTCSLPLLFLLHLKE